MLTSHRRPEEILQPGGFRETNGRSLRASQEQTDIETLLLRGPQRHHYAPFKAKARRRAGQETHGGGRGSLLYAGHPRKGFPAWRRTPTEGTPCFTQDTHGGNSLFCAGHPRKEFPALRRTPTGVIRPHFGHIWPQFGSFCSPCGPPVFFCIFFKTITTRATSLQKIHFPGKKYNYQ